MKIENKEYRTIWFDEANQLVKIIDQTKLPHQFIIKDLKTVKDAINAIKTMEVRGAPLIGGTAAYGIVLAIMEKNNPSFVKQSSENLIQSRPTAINLKWAVDRMMKKISGVNNNELLKVEKAKVKSAILTDFILSLEIIMLALGEVVDSNLITQIAVVTFISIIATLGVYGLVALLVRIDDAGFYLIKISEQLKGVKKIVYLKTGKGLVWVLPKIIKVIGIIGTLAMLLVGGGIFVHNIHQIHDFFHLIPTIATELLTGFFVGLITFLFYMIVIKLRSVLKKDN